MPKFARPNSYTGKQSNQNWTGDSRAATVGEALSGDSKQLYISPSTLAAVSADLVDLALLAPGPIGSVTPNTIDGTIITAHTRFQVDGGAVTDSIGTATLALGTATVLNTNIAAGDRIFPAHEAINASTGIGTLHYTISAGVSFTITSLDATGATETGDLSTISYLIVRQV